LFPFPQAFRGVAELRRFAVGLPPIRVAIPLVETAARLCTNSGPSHPAGLSPSPVAESCTAPVRWVLPTHISSPRDERTSTLAHRYQTADNMALSARAHTSDGCRRSPCVWCAWKGSPRPRRDARAERADRNCHWL